MLLRQTAAGGAADLDGLELGAVLQPAADVENDLPQGRAHGHLDQSDVLDGAGEGEGLAAGAAGGAVADLDDVFPLGFKGKVLVKRRHGVGLGLCDPDLLGHIAQQLCGKIAVLRLNILHNGNQRPRIPDVAGNILVRFAVVGCCA